MATEAVASLWPPDRSGQRLIADPSAATIAAASNLSTRPDCTGSGGGAAARVRRRDATRDDEGASPKRIVRLSRLAAVDMEELTACCAAAEGGGRLPYSSVTTVELKQLTLAPLIRTPLTPWLGAPRVLIHRRELLKVYRIETQIRCTHINQIVSQPPRGWEKQRFLKRLDIPMESTRPKLCCYCTRHCQ